MLKLITSANDGFPSIRLLVCFADWICLIVSSCVNGLTFKLLMRPLIVSHF